MPPPGQRLAVRGRRAGLRLVAAGHRAALLAYYGFFSLFPLLLVAVTVLGFVLQGQSDLGQRIVAWVVPSGRADDAVAATLVAHVAEELAWHKRPREVRFTDSLPRNAMGKIQKKQLDGVV